ncbi:MAG: DUF805 domain-containing protein [Pseudomonadota bacterium]
MGLADAIRTAYPKYATFSGRATRSEFWWYQLFCTVIIGVPIAVVSELLHNIWVLVNVLPLASVAARRLHDIDRSGWWQLLPLLATPFLVIPLLNSGFDFETSFDPIYFLSPTAWIGVVFVVGLHILVTVWYATPGTKGPNRFGEDPFGRSNASIFE